MQSSAGPRLALSVLLGLTCLVTIGFAVAIVANVGSGVGPHEIAGLLLLTLLIGAAWVSYRLRAIDPRLLVRVLVALGALVTAGTLGAVLATSPGSGLPAGAPLVPLAALLIAAGDGLRLTVALRAPPRSA